MRPTTWLMIALVSMLTVSFFLLFYLDLFETSTFIGILVVIFDYLGVYMFLLLTKNEQDHATNEKDKLPYCWTKASEMLRYGMPGGDKLEWWGGEGRNSQVRTYYDGNQRRKFRSLYGFLTRNKQGVIILWDIDGEDIAAYWTQPSVQRLSDPFHEFKPFFREDSMQRGLMSLLRRGKGRGRGININYGGAQEMPDIEPDDDTVRRASFKPGGGNSEQ